jgi:hypothetical protein
MRFKHKKNVFESDLELTGIFDSNLFAGFATLRTKGFNLFDDIHAFDNGSKDDMFAVKP